MEKKIEDYLHFYIGCECKIMKTDKTWNVLLDLVRPITAMTIYMVIDTKQLEVKPVLSRLIDMNASQKNELRSIMRPMTGDNLLPKIPVSHFLDLFINKNDPEIIIWLTRQGFDIFGLIDAGIAIDKNTINTSHGK